MIKRFALLLSALLSLGLHAQAQTFPSPTVQNFTVLGTMTASGLTTSGTIANSLCQTSAGSVLSVAGANCFGGGGGGGISGLVAGQLSIAGSPTTLTSSIPFGVTGTGSFIPAASGGLLSPGVLPLASASSFGAAECDNTTITCPGGVFSAVSGGSGNVVSPGSGFTVGDLIKANNTAGTAILDANVVAANVVTSSGTLTNNFLLVGVGAKAVGQVASLGTTTTVLHGNAAGLPSFGPVVLTTDVSGNLPVTNLNSGTSASSTTFWRGDSTWATPSAGSAAFNAITSGTNTTAAMLVGTGGSLGPTGSGTVTATNVPAALGTGTVCSTAGPLSVSAGCPIVPTAISTSTVALVAANAGQLVLATNASPTTMTLAQSTGSLGAGFGLDAFTDPSTSTLNVTTSTLNGLSSIKLGAYQDIAIAAIPGGNYVGAISVPQPPTQTHTTCLFDDFVWSACSGSGTLTASGSITNGSLGIWASGTSLSGTVLPGTGVLTFLATPSSANLAAAVTGETGTGALVFGTSPTIASPAFSGTSTGTYTLGGTLTLGNGAVATTQTTGDNTTKVATDAFVIANAGGGGTLTNLTLAPGFTTTIGTQNTAGQNITTTGTINGQLWPEPQTANYTVLTSDTGALPLANGSGSITFTLPNAATGTKGTTYQFNDESGHGYTLATVGAAQNFLGCSGGGGTTLAVSASTGVSVVDNGTSYSCLLYGGGGGSSGLSGMTAGSIPIAATSSTVTSSLAPVSGGVAYGSSSSSWASSAALTNNTIVVGGGAGSAPKVGVATDTGSLFAPNEPMSYAQAYGTPTVLTPGATVATNAALGNFFTLAIGANTTLSYPTGVPSGKRQMVLYEVTQPSSGGPFTLTLGSGFSPSSISLNPTASSMTPFSCDLGSASGTCQGGANSGTANCSSGASPAVCGAAANGSVAIPAGAAQTLVVNTTTITANSSITVDYDQSATVAGATCSTTTPTATVFAPLVITARTVGTSFTVENPGTTVTNPACINFHIN